MLPAIDTLCQLGISKDNAFFDRCTNYLLTIKQQASEKGMKENDFWMMVTDNLIAEKQEQELEKTSRNLAQTVRDGQMAKNLLWLAKIYY